MKQILKIFALLVISALSISQVTAQFPRDYEALLMRYGGFTQYPVTDPISGNKVIYFFGGREWSQGPISNELIKIDNKTWKFTKIENPTGDLPPRLLHCQVSFLDNKIYVTDGNKYDKHSNYIGSNDSTYIL